MSFTSETLHKINYVQDNSSFQEGKRHLLYPGRMDMQGYYQSSHIIQTE